MLNMLHISLTTLTLGEYKASTFQMPSFTGAIYKSVSSSFQNLKQNIFF